MSEAGWKEEWFAHIVSPASKWREVLEGKKTKVKALCGAFVRRQPATEAPVCRLCFDEQMKRDRATATDLETAGAEGSPLPQHSRET